MFANHQRGSALLTALLVVSLVVGFVLYIHQQQRYLLIATRASIVSAAAFQYALAMEALAVEALQSAPQPAVSVQDQNATRQQLVFPYQLPFLKTEMGKVTGEIQDLQSQFNINLITDDKAVYGFLNLLDIKFPEIEKAERESLVNLIRKAMTEQGPVDSPQPLFRYGGMPFMSVTELYGIPGITPARYKIWRLHWLPYLLKR